VPGRAPFHPRPEEPTVSPNLPAGHIILPPDAPRDQWLAARRSGIGGSDMPLLVGVSNAKHGTEFDLWREKTGRFIAPHERGGPMMRGTWLEPNIADVFVKETGLAVETCGLVQSNTEPIALMTPDRLEGDDGLVEIKSMGSWAPVRQEWRRGGVSRAAFVQGQWGLGVTGRQYLWLVAYEIDQYPIIRGPFPRDEKLISSMFVRARSWWDAHVVADSAPAVNHDTITDDEIRARWPHNVGESIEAEWPDYLLAMREERRQVHATLREAAARKKEIDAAAKIMAADYAAITVNGEPIVTFNEHDVAPVIDPAMEWEEPEMWDRYVTRGSTRAIRWIKRKA
jgi:putative phage-type endonuclease